MTSYASILCLDDRERELAIAALTKHGEAVEEGSYLSGELSDDDFETLFDAGIVVNETPAPEIQVNFFGDDLPAADDVMILDDDVPGPPPTPRGQYVVDFLRPLGARERELVEQGGGSIVAQLGSNRFAIETTLDLAHAIRDTTDLVAAVTVYGVEATLSREQLRRLEEGTTVGAAVGAASSGADNDIFLSADDDFSFSAATPDFDSFRADAIEDADGTGAGATPPGGPQFRPIHVLCKSGHDVDALAAEIAALPGVREVEHWGRRIACKLQTGAQGDSALVDIARLDSSQATEDYVPPDILLQFAVPALLRDAANAGAAPFPLRGKGQKLVISDTGIDAQHPDFAGRCTVVKKATPVATRDPDGHGTHVASIAAGAGTASGGKLAGVAPEAEIRFQSLAGAAGRLEGAGKGVLPLLQDGFDSGARVHNLSWGSNVTSGYVLNSVELDEFVRDHEEYLVIVAGGNAGRQDADTADGSYSLESLYAPATAKNCLTVGACCSPRTDGPFAGLLWRAYPGDSRPTFSPMTEEQLTGKADILASLSSRGPAQGERIKPDLVAPGVGIAAARAADSENPGSFPYDPDTQHYVYKNGTSMAAPMVAGAALLLREYLEGREMMTPSAALMKAALINGTVWIDAPSGEDGDGSKPNFHQGFGRLVLERVFPFDPAAGFELRLADIKNGAAGALSKGSAAWRRKFNVQSADRPLSLTLAWTDMAGPGAAHVLDFLLIDPNGAKIPGNPNLKRLNKKLFFDHKNNVQQIRVDAPTVGTWTVAIAPFNVWNGAQGFGLAATGAITDLAQ